MSHRSGRSVAWLARLLGVQEVASSNLAAPTILLHFLLLRLPITTRGTLDHGAASKCHKRSLNCRRSGRRRIRDDFSVELELAMRIIKTTRVPFNTVRQLWKNESLRPTRRVSGSRRTCLAVYR